LKKKNKNAEVFKRQRKNRRAQNDAKMNDENANAESLSGGNSRKIRARTEETWRI